MPIDAIFLSALISEITQVAQGARVEKVRMPEKDTVVLSLRGISCAKNLLLSCGAGDARLHFTDETFEYPSQPPMFCMLLRKHLLSAQLREIVQIPGERAVVLSFYNSDSFGERKDRFLIIELMGRYSNLILTDENYRILDCLRRIDFTMSDKRQVLPGLKYEEPPKQNKPDISVLCVDTPVYDPADSGTPCDKWLLKHYAGICPLVCREIVFSAFGCVDTPMSESCFPLLLNSASNMILAVQTGRYTPCLLVAEDGRPLDFYCFSVRQYGIACRVEIDSSFSDLLFHYYSRRASVERLRQKSSGLLKHIKTLRDRTLKKLAIQRSELAATENREEFRQNGDIISANIHRMQKGMNALTANDFYGEEGTVKTIPLDPSKSPQQNAAWYYKKYTKEKNAEKILKVQINLGEQEVNYLNSVMEEIHRASGEKELNEIQQELILSGTLKSKKLSGKQQKIKLSAPKRFRSSSGYEILVGKNNLQNDELTTKRASKADYWLHTQKIHGSHVIILCEGKTPDPTTLTEAAILAALHSDASAGSKVPVDYTKIKNVKKPSGAKPGFVTYQDYKTLLVTPNVSLAEKLAVK